MTIAIKIRDRNGWKYAVIPRLRGAALIQTLHTRSDAEAQALVRGANLQQIALAGKADALTREVWTRLLTGKNIRIRDAVSSYNAHRHIVGHAETTIDTHTGVIDHWLRFTGIANESVSVIESRHVADFVNQPTFHMLSTRQKWLEVFNGFLGWMCDQRWIIKNPADDVRVRIDRLTQEQLVSVPIPAFNDDQVKAILEVIPKTDFWHGAVLFGYHYGLRISTVVTLEETNVVANTLRIYTKKGRRIVNELLHDDIIDWLEVWRGVRPASDLPYLFPAQAAAGMNTVKSQFRRLLIRHKVADRSFHSLRKSAANRKWKEALQDLGSNEARALAKMVADHGFQAVQRLLGHAPGSTVTDRHYRPSAG